MEHVDSLTPHRLDRARNRKGVAIAQCSCGEFSRSLGRQDTACFKKISAAFAEHVMACRELVPA